MIVGLAGKAGVGKDTAAKVLVEKYGFDLRALADPVKRICRDVFSFTNEQLYGPSERRNREDSRYVREDGQPLTPRYALQRLGTEWGRHCYPDVWVNLLLQRYHRKKEYSPSYRLVVPDVRFANEVSVLRNYGIVVLIRRPQSSLSGEAAAHASETVLDRIPLTDFDAIIDNDGSIEDLQRKVRLCLFPPD